MIRFVPTVGTLVFADRIRPVEWMSALSLGLWAAFFAMPPEGFSDGAWFSILIVVVSIQMTAIIFPLLQATPVRIAAVALAAGVWFVIGLSDLAGAQLASAATHFVYCAACAASGAYLGWTK